MAKVKIKKEKGDFAKILLWIVAAVGLFLAIVIVTYIRSGWSFFDAGKKITLNQLPSDFGNDDQTIVLTIDKESMAGDLLFGQLSYSGSFTYQDGCLDVDISSYPERNSDGSRRPDGVFTVVQADVIYWPSQDLFLTGSAA